MRTFLRFSFVLLLTTSLSGIASAQTIALTGQVTDRSDRSPVQAIVSVLPNGTSKTGTDFQGRFSLEVRIGDSLLVEAFGYGSKRLKVTSSQPLAIALAPNQVDLGEVVVTGYGSSTKKEMTGATSVVKSEEITKLNIPRMDQALQGQVAGVVINTNSGSPGGSTSIRIRGLSTFGDNDPLILVDGVVYDSEGLNALNPNDIASINVLKDGTASIFGVRAANGVILIETKKGQKGGAPVFEYASYLGVQQTAKRLGLLNAQEYAVLKNNAFLNGGQDQPFANTALGVGTDWQDAVFQSAMTSSHSLSATGSSNQTTYSIGGSYFTQDGIVGGDKSNFSRYNGRVNLSTDMTSRLRLNSVFLFTHEERKTLPENGIGSVLFNTINAYPTEPLVEEDGRYSYLALVSDIINPIAQMANTYNQTGVNKFVGKEELAWTVNESLTWTNRFNYNYALVDGRVFSPLVWYGPGKAQNTAVNADLDAPMVTLAEGFSLERGPSVYQHRDTYGDLTFESYLNYDRTFGEDHHVKATAGTSVFTRQGKGLGAWAFNIPNNSWDYADISASQAAGGYLNGASSFFFEERLLSAFGRAEYAYKSRYLVSGVLRRDGSSKFGPNARWGIFPAISGAWVISDEPAYRWAQTIDFAKLRASFGVAGNDQIPNFAYRALLNGEGVYPFNDLLTPGVAIGRASNPDLKWETTRQANLGLDLRIRNALNITLNAFEKRTSDLLFQPEVSGVLGTYSAGGYPPFINAGDVRNRGVELEMAYATKPTRTGQFTASFNATYLQNKVLRVPDGVDFIPGAGFGVGGNVATRFEAGFPIGYFHGFVTDGIFQSQAEIDNSPVVQAGARPGDLRFVDVNGDGVINFSNNSDKTQIGSPIPDFTLGLNLNYRYKAFDVSTNLYAAIGQEIIRNYERQQPYANMLDYTIGRWTGNGSSNDVPRLTTSLTRNTVFSDFFVEKGDFLRVRNLQMGYTLSESLTERLGARKVRMYLSGNNLFTLTGYQGFDPDIGNFGGVLAAGVDYGFYPQARTLMVGLTLQF